MSTTRRLVSAAISIAALAALGALPAAASAAPSLGTPSQLAGPNSCVISTTDGSDPAAGTNTPSNLACTGEDTTSEQALNLPLDQALSPDGRFDYVVNTLNDSVLVFQRNQSDEHLTQVAGTAGCIADSTSSDSNCTNTATEMIDPRSIVVSPDGGHVYVASAQFAYEPAPPPPPAGSRDVTSAYGGGVVVFSRNSTTGQLTYQSCVSEGGENGCTTGHGLDGARGLAISGSHLYVAASPGGNYGSIAILSIGSNGDLTQAAGANTGDSANAGTAGCVLHAPGDTYYDDGCYTHVSALEGSWNVAASPDGKSLYGVSRDWGNGMVVINIGTEAENAALTVWSITDPVSGNIQQAPQTLGCIAEDPSLDAQLPLTNYSACSVGHGLGGLNDVVVSPDGKNVYTAGDSISAYLLNITGGGGVARFDRDPSTSIVNQPDGKAGCWNEQGADGCQAVRALTNAVSVAASPDGRNVYATSSDAAYESEYYENDFAGPRSASRGVFTNPYKSLIGDDSLVAFGRDPGTGALSQLGGTDGCAEEVPGNDAPNCSAAIGLTGAADVVVAPDDEGVYVTSLASRYKEGPAGSRIVLPGNISAVGAYNRTDQSPTCTDVTGTTPPATPLGVQLACTDPDSNPLTFALVSNPGHGTLSGFDPATGRVTYTPAAGFTGTDTFTYHATDIGDPADATSNTATVTITVPAAAASRSLARIALSRVRKQCSRTPRLSLVTNARAAGAHPTVRVYLDGRRIKVGHNARMRISVSLRHLRRGVHRLRITVTANGRTVSRTIRFRACAAARRVSPRFTG